MKTELIYFARYDKLLRVTSDNPSAAHFQVYSTHEDMQGKIKVINEEGRGFGLDKLFEGYVEFSGRIKWDGCIDWSTDRDCQLHGCGPEHVNMLHDIFATAFNFAHSWLDGHWFTAPAIPETAALIGNYT